MPPGLRPLAFLLALALWGCDELGGLDKADGDSLVKRSRTQLALGERIPNDSEAHVVGIADDPIQRGSSAFKSLVVCEDCPFVFKNEEKNESDRLMTARLRRDLLQLSKLVSQ